jgi:flagellar hook-length control protein FliK
MQINLPAALTPPAAPPAEVHAPSRAPAAHPFAEMLRQSRKPVEPPAAPASTEPADDAAEGAAAPEASATPLPTSPAKAKARSSATPTPSRASRAEAGAAHDAPAAGGPKNDADAKPAATHAGDGSLAPWLQQVQLAAAGRADAAARAADKGDAASGTDRLVAAQASATSAQDLAAAAATAATDPRATAPAHGSADGAAADPAALFRAEVSNAVATSGSDAAHPVEAAGARAEPGAAASPIGGVLFTPTGSVAEAPAPAVASLPTPFNAPDFAQAFGLQVSLLAEGGVQHAELQLNPAEMGPVSVHIRMDGTDARVDFGADAAATRQAIEAGLPELASALRDAGFTLTGGGVSQHSQGRRDEADAGSKGRGTGARDGRLEAEALRPVAVRAAALGGVDLYA